MRDVKSFATLGGACCCVMLPMASSFVTNTPITTATTVHVNINNAQKEVMAHHRKNILHAAQYMHPRNNALSASALFVVPQNKHNDKDTTSLFSTISPGDNEDEQSITTTTTPSTSIIDTNENDSPFVKMQTIGIRTLVAIITVAIFSNIASVFLSMTTSIGNELALELGNFLHIITWVIGGVLKFFGGMAWEGTKVAAPVVGKAVVSGAQQFGEAAAPMVQDAAQQLGNAAAPVIKDATQQMSNVASPYAQEAARQVTEAASPYIDSVSNSVSEAVVTPIASAVGSVSSQAMDAVSSTMDSVSNQAAEVVAPIRDAADVVSSTVDETLVAPMKAVGESIPFRVF